MGGQIPALTEKISAMPIVELLEFQRVELIQALGVEQWGPPWSTSLNNTWFTDALTFMTSSKVRWQAVGLRTNDSLTLTESGSGESAHSAERIAIKFTVERC